MKKFRKFFIYAFSMCVFLAVTILGTACDFNSTGHTFSERWSVSETEHWHACTNAGCTMYKDKAYHTSSDWIIDKAATQTEDGTKHKECLVCKYITKTDVVYAWSKFENTKYTWNSDFSKCTAYKKCKVNDLSSVSETVDVICEIKQEASCEKDKIIKYTANFQNSIFQTQTKEINLGGHTGHDYGAVTYKWLNDYSVCVARKICENDPTHIEEEYATSTYDVTTPASCKSNEKRCYTATFANSEFSTQTKDVEIQGSMGAHIYNYTYAWTTEGGLVYCTASRTCENCDHKETEKEQAGYSIKTPATCESNEVRIYTVSFYNQNFKIQRNEMEIKDSALGHDYTTTYQWSDDNLTCTAKRICEHDSEDIITEIVSTNNVVKSEADCDNDKMLTYKATFTNSIFEEQTKDVGVEGTRLGHLFGDVTYVWNSDYTTCTARRICSRDSHIEEEIASVENESVTYSVKSQATCENNGVLKYTAVFENEAFSKQTKEVEIEGTKLGHTYSDVEYLWSNDYSTCTALRVCENDNEHVEKEIVDVNCEIVVSVDKNERRIYTAIFENPAFEKQKKTEIKTDTILGNACLANAISESLAIDNATIKLMSDITLSSILEIVADGKTVKIDLNGYTIKSTTNTLFKVKKGVLELDNGKLETENVPNMCVRIEGYDSIAKVILGEDLVVHSKDCVGVFIVGNKSELISSANITASGEYAAIQGNGTGGKEYNSITINGGSIVNDYVSGASAMYIPNGKNLTITAGTVKGATALYIKSGIVNISGGEFIGTAESYTSYLFNENGGNETGDAVVIDACGYPWGNPQVTITGGIFTVTGSGTHKIGIYNYNGNVATVNAEGYESDIFVQTISK